MAAAEDASTAAGGTVRALSSTAGALSGGMPPRRSRRASRPEEGEPGLPRRAPSGGQVAGGTGGNKGASSPAAECAFITEAAGVHGDDVRVGPDADAAANFGSFPDSCESRPPMGRCAGGRRAPPVLAGAAEYMPLPFTERGLPRAAECAAPPFAAGAAECGLPG